MNTDEFIVQLNGATADFAQAVTVVKKADEKTLSFLFLTTQMDAAWDPQLENMAADSMVRLAKRYAKNAGTTLEEMRDDMERDIGFAREVWEGRMSDKNIWVDDPQPNIKPLKSEIVRKNGRPIEARLVTCLKLDNHCVDPSAVFALAGAAPISKRLQKWTGIFPSKPLESRPSEMDF